MGFKKLYIKNKNQKLKMIRLKVQIKGQYHIANANF